jgi:hypothetical protein
MQMEAPHAEAAQVRVPLECAMTSILVPSAHNTSTCNTVLHLRKTTSAHQLALHALVHTSNGRTGPALSPSRLLVTHATVDQIVIHYNTRQGGRMARKLQAKSRPTVAHLCTGQHRPHESREQGQNVTEQWLLWQHGRGVTRTASGITLKSTGWYVLSLLRAFCRVPCQLYLNKSFHCCATSGMHAEPQQKPRSLGHMPTAILPPAGGWAEPPASKMIAPAHRISFSAIQRNY